MSGAKIDNQRVIKAAVKAGIEAVIKAMTWERPTDEWGEEQTDTIPAAINH